MGFVGRLTTSNDGIKGKSEPVKPLGEMVQYLTRGRCLEQHLCICSVDAHHDMCKESPRGQVWPPLERVNDWKIEGQEMRSLGTLAKSKAESQSQHQHHLSQNLPLFSNITIHRTHTRSANSVCYSENLKEAGTIVADTRWRSTMSHPVTPLIRPAFAECIHR